MRYFFTDRDPPPTRMLLVESGPRSVIEKIMPHLREVWGAEFPIDLLTCYPGLPEGFGSETVVYRTADYGSPAGRKELVKILRRGNYSAAGIVCAAEPIMTGWKWLIALRLPAKFFILNENSDYFWVHRKNAATIRHFALVRLGLSGAGAFRTIARLIAFPFAVLFLLLYAFTAHAGRILRQIFHPVKT